jgi:hypothetical protein
MIDPDAAGRLLLRVRSERYKRTIFLEMSLGGKFQAKSSGCDEN